MSVRKFGGPDFMRNNAPWLSAGLLLAFSSSFGQTYFIALFAEPLQAAFDLSHGEWGRLYTIATLCSAVALIQAGKLADIMRVRSLALLIYAAFILVCIAMANVQSGFMLGLVIFGLRFCGQGMMSHISMTAMGRWFARQRGKAVAFAALGYPLGEALFPFAAVALIAGIGWRQTWLAAAMILAFVLGPLLMFLLRQERIPSSQTDEAGQVAGIGGRHWQRSDVLRHNAYWALMPGVLAPPFISTALFFHQAHIISIKDWSLLTYAASFPLFSGAGITAALVSGYLVDRYGTTKLLPFYLLPLAGALILLGLFSAPWIMFPYLILIGLTSGIASTILGALWAELYGTRHLGAVRAMAVAGMVLGTALGPGLTGSLIDIGISFTTQSLVMAAYLIIVSIGFGRLAISIQRELLPVT